MDSDMREEGNQLNLKEYITQYSGHQRIVKLLQIVENACHNKKISEQFVSEALTQGYNISADSKALGLYIKLQNAGTKYFKAIGKQVPTNL